MWGEIKVIGLFDEFFCFGRGAGLPHNFDMANGDPGGVAVYYGGNAHQVQDALLDGACQVGNCISLRHLSIPLLSHLPLLLDHSIEPSSSTLRGRGDSPWGYQYDWRTWPALRTGDESHITWHWGDWRQVYCELIRVGEEHALPDDCKLLALQVKINLHTATWSNKFLSLK